MKKTFCSFLFLFFFLFSVPAYAAPSTQPSWWDRIVAFFVANFRVFFSKEYKIDPNRVGLMHEYNADPNNKNDYTSHALPESVREANKKLYLEQVLQGIYPDRDLASCETGKPLITLLDLANYKKDGTHSKDSAECYDKIYKDLYVVPKGGNSDTGSSQANINMRQLIPAAKQSQDGTSMEENTNLQEAIFLQNMLPQAEQNKPGDDLREKFKNSLRPEAWKK